MNPTEQRTAIYNLMAVSFYKKCANIAGVLFKGNIMDSGLATATRLIIHGTMNEKPLCRFSNELPKNWPDGHERVDARWVDSITCPKCKTEAEIMLANKVGT